MKRLLPLLFAWCFGLWVGAVPASGLPADVQADITLEKIVSLIKEGRDAEALPYFEQLDGMKRSLPETFQLYYIRALEKAGRTKDGLARASLYFERHGREGKHYKDVVAIASRLSMDQEKRDAAKQAAQAKAMDEYRHALASYQDAMKTYEDDVRRCPSRFWDKLRSAMNRVERATAACNPPNRACSCEYERERGLNNCGKREALKEFDSSTEDLAELESGGERGYCEDRYTKPTPPVKPL